MHIFYFTITTDIVESSEILILVYSAMTYCSIIHFHWAEFSCFFTKMAISCGNKFVDCDFLQNFAFFCYSHFLHKITSQRSKNTGNLPSYVKRGAHQKVYNVQQISAKNLEYTRQI